LRKNHDTPRDKRPRAAPEAGKERYRIDVGREHGVKPGNIVGAIANEAGLDGEHIGPISIEGSFSLVDLPVGMPRALLMDLKKVRVCGRPLKIAVDGRPDAPPKKRKHGKPAR
jgi:ATP-dependent RNA helicase DeaD